MQPKMNKTKKNSSFFRRIKKIKLQDTIGILGLLLATFTLWYSCDKEKSLEQQLQKAKEGHIIIKRLGFYSYREITKAQLDTTKWGYPLVTTSGGEDFKANLDKLSVNNFLIGINTSAHDTIADPSIISIPEFQKKIAPLKLSSSDTIKIYKRYRIMIDFQNMGLEQCKLTSILVYLKNPDASDFNQPFELGNASTTLEQGESTIFFIHFDWGLQQKLSEPFDVKVEFVYLTKNNKAITKKEIHSFDKYGWRKMDAL